MGPKTVEPSESVKTQDVKHVQAAYSDYWHSLYKDHLQPIPSGDTATFKAAC